MDHFIDHGVFALYFKLFMRNLLIRIYLINVCPNKLIRDGGRASIFRPITKK